MEDHFEVWSNWAKAVLLAPLSRYDLSSRRPSVAEPQDSRDYIHDSPQCFGFLRIGDLVESGKSRWTTGRKHWTSSTLSIREARRDPDEPSPFWHWGHVVAFSSRQDESMLCYGNIWCLRVTVAHIMFALLSCTAVVILTENTCLCEALAAVFVHFVFVKISH